MDIAVAMATMFPAGRVIECGARPGAAVEVHGLPLNTVPVNCEVVDYGPSKFSRGRARRDLYLVRTDRFLVLLRICAAGPDAGDGAFVVSHDYAPLQDGQAQTFQEIARKSIERLCTVPDHRLPGHTAT
jgi:hypothetical protein